MTDSWEVIEPLYRGSFTQLCRYVQQQSGAARTDAEDIVQAAFVKLRANLSRVKTPKAYLERAVQTGMVDWSRRQIVVDPDEESVLVNPPSLLTFHQIEQRDRIISALAAMTPRHREAVALVHLRGLTLAEAGLVMGVSHQAVSLHLAKMPPHPS